MSPRLKNFLRSVALELPIYIGLVTAYILVVLKYLQRPLSQWFQSDRTLYAGAALVLIIGQGLVLELATSILENRFKKRRR